jgi:hypothetical protein
LERTVRALVVYETLWGNTEKVARAIAAELQSSMTVEVVDSDSAPIVFEGFDLLVVGGPTHAFSMTRASTRDDAVVKQGAPHAPQRGIREWLHLVAGQNHTIRAAVFDTRVNAPRLPGSAAKAAQQELRSLGFEIVVKQKTFRVHGSEGPLVDGELERATEWAREIGRTVSAG